MFLVIQSGTIAAVAVAFAKFLGVLWPAISTQNEIFGIGSGARRFSFTTLKLVGLAVIGTLTWSNATGLKTGTRTQNVFTFAKFAALLTLTILGLVLTGGTDRALARPGSFMRRRCRASRWSDLRSWLRSGRRWSARSSQSAWNNVTLRERSAAARAHAAGAAHRLPHRHDDLRGERRHLNVLPFAKVQHAPEDRVATAAATALWGPGAAAAMAVAIMVSTFGCVNGLILSGARVSFAMARDGLFFSGLTKLNPASVPSPALWAQALWCAVLVLTGSYSDLLKYVISADLLFYVLLVVAVIVMRVKRPDWPRPFRAPGYPILPLAYAAGGLALIAILLVGNPRTTWPGYLLVLTGVPIYFLLRRGA
jgi:APA family basic amino acid/polyamine antiporter